MKKAKSTRGFFEAILAGKFSYMFHPDLYTSVDEKDIELVTKLYGSSLQFEEMTPEQKLDEGGVVKVELSEVKEEEAPKKNGRVNKLS